jgi:hypothetical protein
MIRKVEGRLLLSSFLNVQTIANAVVIRYGTAIEKKGN